MKTIVYSPEAASDIDQIWDYSAAHWGADQADRYTDEIRDNCYALARGLKRGRAVDIRHGYLKYPTGTHVVYYLDRGDRLDIIRVLHARMDSAEHL